MPRFCSSAVGPRKYSSNTASIGFLSEGTSRVTGISDGKPCSLRFWKSEKKTVISTLDLVGVGVLEGVTVNVDVKVVVGVCDGVNVGVYVLDGVTVNVGVNV